jgi:hypothetical protein
MPEHRGGTTSEDHDRHTLQTGRNIERNRRVGHAVIALSGGTHEFACAAHADVTIARNLLAAHFLAGDCTRFVGIDDDVSVSANAFAVMLSADSSFVGAVLPQRTMNLDLLEQAILSGHRGRQARAIAAPPVSGGSGSYPAYGSVQQVDRIGTGFYILDRSVLMGIISQGLAVCERVSQANATVIAATYGFFNNISDESGYLSEDYSFCKRVTDAGYSVNAYYGPGIGHTGSMTFTS